MTHQAHTDSADYYLYRFFLAVLVLFSVLFIIFFVLVPCGILSCLAASLGCTLIYNVQ